MTNRLRTWLRGWLGINEDHAAVWKQLESIAGYAHSLKAVVDTLSPHEIQRKKWMKILEESEDPNSEAAQILLNPAVQREVLKWLGIPGMELPREHKRG